MLRCDCLNTQGKDSIFSVLQTEQSYKRNPKALDQFQYCEQNGIPLAIILGQSEIENNFVKLRNIATREEVCISNFWPCHAKMCL